MMRKTIGTVAIAVFAVLSMASAASAQTYTTGVLGSDTTKPAPGQTITLTGSNCPKGGPVNFAIDGSPAGGTVADSNGNFSGTVTAPSSPGTHNVTATCGAQVLALEITVQAASTGAALPRTGTSSTLPLSSIALVLLALGGLLVLTARRRRVAARA